MPRSPTYQAGTCSQAGLASTALSRSPSRACDAGRACTKSHRALCLVDGIYSHHGACLPRPLRVASHARRALPDVVAGVLDAREVELRALDQQLAAPGVVL